MAPRAKRVRFQDEAEARKSLMVALARVLQENMDPPDAEYAMQIAAVAVRRGVLGEGEGGG